MRIDYTGLSDADTIFNPTNHSYFNLAGHDAGDSAMDQLVWINASRFTQTDPASIPDGVLLDVAGTPMDFTTPKPMAPEIDDAYSFLAWPVVTITILFSTNRSVKPALQLLL